MTIWKYQLEIKDGLQARSIPEEAIIISVGMQNGVPTFWAEVDPDHHPEPRYFQVHGTGHPITNGGVFVGSAVGIPFVWHIYEHSAKHRNLLYPSTDV